MRPRIRSLKPEIHTDEELWDLEVEAGLPLFRAFTGLWNYSDREGRFEWRPRALKAMILPYWDGDFEHALDALASRRFIVRYSVGGKQYGWVRKLKDHQAFNAREPASLLPSPPAEVMHVHAHAEHDSAHGELELELEGNGAGTELGAPRAPAHVATGEPKPDTAEPAAPVEPPLPEVPGLRRVFGGGVARTFTMPEHGPTKSYLDAASMAGVHAKQARDTWAYWQGKGLPADGVERLEAWLVHSAKERQERLAGAPARASPRTSHNRTASKQPNAGLTGFESLKEPA